MSSTDNLLPLLKTLHFSNPLQSLELRTKHTIKDNLANGEFLFILLGDEVERREAKQFDRRLRYASLDHRKTLVAFHFSLLVPKAKMIDARNLRFRRVARQRRRRADAA